MRLHWTMIHERCGHGKPWSEHCKECEIVSLKEFLKHFGEKVDNARKKLAELGEAIDEQCPVCGYYCLGKGGQDCIDKPAMKGHNVELTGAALAASSDRRERG